MDAMTSLVQQYGYAKVTMDDIAKASGLSRPALYQFFKNKQEIYRAIADSMLEDWLGLIDKGMATGNDARQQIFNGLKLGLLDPLAQMESTTHGAELLDLKNELSTDIIERFSEGLQARLTAGYSVFGENLPLPADAMARHLRLWFEGMKQHERDPEKREAALQQFLDMQFAGIRRNSA